MKRQKDWIFRMETELQRSTSGCFLTLTYEQPPVSENGLFTLNSQHVTKFMKRLRKRNKMPIKYYSIGEYGSKFKRPHYHLIVFNLSNALISRSERICSIWHGGKWERNVIPGIIQVDPATSGTIGYVAGYCQQGTWKPEHDTDTGLFDDRRPHYSTMSKGLGANYLTQKQIEYHRKNELLTICRPGGYLQRLPRYYASAIFNRQEREAIIEKNRLEMEFDFEKWFKNAEHQVEYTREAQRLFEKKLKLERQAL
jgi:hypothetical protein